MFRDTGTNPAAISSLQEAENLAGSEAFRYAINLMWINDQNDNHGKFVAGRMNYVLSQLKKWQRDNPEAEINFWYDSQRTNENAITNTLNLLEAYSINPDNPIRLRDIWEIPIVQKNADFFTNSVPVYFGIDILKLIICHYLMTMKGMHSVIITDISIADKVDHTLGKSELYASHFLKTLFELGMMLGHDGEKIENQFIQMLNTPQLIQALTHGINTSFYIARNTLNNLVSEEFLDDDPRLAYPRRAASHITMLPFYAAQSQIYIYLLSMAHPDGIKIRADVAGEGNASEWVSYQPKKHGYILFGNQIKYTQMTTGYYDPANKQWLYVKEYVKFPESLHFSPEFTSFAKAFKRLDCRVGDEVVRQDLNPGHTGKSHEWNGSFSYRKIACTFLPLNEDNPFPAPKPDEAREAKPPETKKIQDQTFFQQASLANENQIFLLHGISKRIVTLISLQENDVIKHHRFYRSSHTADDNPNYAETWFPMGNWRPNGYVEKPADYHIYKDPYTDFYPAPLIEFIKSCDSLKYMNTKGQNDVHELIRRFGNFECMCISYVIGGGYWATEDAQALDHFLEDNYDNELSLIFNTIQNLDDIKEIHARDISKKRKFTGTALFRAVPQLCKLEAKPDFTQSFFTMQKDKDSLYSTLKKSK